MNFPDDVTLLRATGADEYGNPASSWTAPSQTPVKAFVLATKVLLPAGTDARAGDRFTGPDGRLYEIKDRPVNLRSPRRSIMVRADIGLVEGA